jgi:type I restriction enzyme S subunit
MISALKPYSDFKETGLPWAPKLPSHWDLLPNRAIVRKRKVLVGVRHFDYKLLSLTKGGVIIRDISKGKGKFSSDMGTSQEVRKGDLVFCLFDVPETPRTVGLSLHDGMITGAYTVFESRRQKPLEFFELFYLAMDDRKLLSPLYSGLRNTIPPARFLGVKTPLPPPAEQEAIVRFLDYAQGRIDRAIKAKKKVITLLNEQKQAIIHKAVTHGLDPSVPLKPSGIPWLGDIPEHWKIRPLKHWVKINRSTIPETTRPDFEFRYIDIGSVGTGFIKKDLDHLTFSESPSRARRVLRCGDTIISTVRTYLKAVWCVDEDGRDLIASTGFAVLSPQKDVEPKYLGYVLQGDNFINRVAASSIGIAYPAISESVLGRFLVALPPDREEQKSIYQNIEKDSEPLSRAIDITRREIDLLVEYRTRLTADVVTGKLDVREAAKNLPEETTEAEADPAILEEDEELEEVEA